VAPPYIVSPLSHQAPPEEQVFEQEMETCSQRRESSVYKPKIDIKKIRIERNKRLSRDSQIG